MAATTKTRRRPPRPDISREYYDRAQLLTAVPLCMSEIDRLEAIGAFPRRIRLTPSRRVVWAVAEVRQFFETRARARAQ